MTAKALLLFSVLLMALPSYGVRLKDIANIRGVRENQLIGYGLVVGLNGTGDSNLEFTSKSMKRMLDKMGMKLNGTEISSQNVASVLLTATLPPFARAGNKLDVTVNSLGDASSLKGGTLVQTPLRAADKNVYAVAQGSLLTSSSHLTVAKLPNGAMVERDLEADFTHRKMYRFTLNNPDMTTAARVAKTINMDLGGQYATPLDPGTVDFIVPFHWEGKGVELLSVIESLQVFPDQKAKVIVNEKSGTVVIGENVKISKVAISHGDITVNVGGNQPAQKRGPASKAVGRRERVHMLEGAESEVNVGELVQSLNRMGIKPKDLIVILQNIKASGALQGDLEIL
ncbi:MAG: flagellar basal body P-ring protein FlgI [Pseudomonadota bacterium]